MISAPRCSGSSMRNVERSLVTRTRAGLYASRSRGAASASLVSNTSTGNVSVQLCDPVLRAGGLTTLFRVLALNPLAFTERHLSLLCRASSFVALFDCRVSVRADFERVWQQMEPAGAEGQSRLALMTVAGRWRKNPAIDLGTPPS